VVKSTHLMPQRRIGELTEYRLFGPFLQRHPVIYGLAAVPGTSLDVKKSHRVSLLLRIPLNDQQFKSSII